MRMPSLTIITVNLNNASGLRSTIESVISQSSSDFEYIIIDGGSTDGSVEIIQSFTNIPQAIYSPCANLEYHKRYAPCPMPITYWISEPDRGIYHAMNKGILAAKGDFCQFLNSGDRLVTHDVIEKMLHMIPDCSIYYGNMLKILPNGKIIRDFSGAGDISLNTFIKGSLNHSPVLIRKSLFEKYGLYDETMQIAADWKFFLIVIGLHDEKVTYVNLDVALFDMTGISNREKNLLERERSQVLNTVLPKSILKDYHLFSSDTIMIKKLKKNSFFWWLICLLYKISLIKERLLVKRIHA